MYIIRFKYTLLGIKWKDLSKEFSRTYQKIFKYFQKYSSNSPLNLLNTFWYTLSAYFAEYNCNILLKKLWCFFSVDDYNDDDDDDGVNDDDYNNDDGSSACT